MTKLLSVVINLHVIKKDIFIKGIVVVLLYFYYFSIIKGKGKMKKTLLSCRT